MSPKPFIRYPGTGIYYARFQSRGKRYLRCLDTTEYAVAEQRAAELASGVRQANWRAKTLRARIATFDELFKLYREHSEHISHTTLQSNCDALLKVFDAKLSDSTSLISASTLNAKKARIAGGDEARAFNRHLRNAKCVFRASMLPIYSEYIVLPPSIPEFLRSRFYIAQQKPQREDLDIFRAQIKAILAKGKQDEWPTDVWLFFMLLNLGFHQRATVACRWEHFHASGSTGVEYQHPAPVGPMDTRRYAVPLEIWLELNKFRADGDETVLPAFSKEPDLTRRLVRLLRKEGLQVRLPVRMLVRLRPTLRMRADHAEFFIPDPPRIEVSYRVGLLPLP